MFGDAVPAPPGKRERCASWGLASPGLAFWHLRLFGFVALCCLALWLCGLVFFSGFLAFWCFSFFFFVYLAPGLPCRFGFWVLLRRPIGSGWPGSTASTCSSPATCIDRTAWSSGSVVQWHHFCLLFVGGPTKKWSSGSLFFVRVTEQLRWDWKNQFKPTAPRQGEDYLAVGQK